MASIKNNSFRGNTVLFNPSTFKTIAIDVANESDPQQRIISEIESSDIDNCVVKIVYFMKPEQIYYINVGKIREKLTRTSFCSITPVVVQNPSGNNFPEVNATLYKSPLIALEKYLSHKPDLDKTELLRKANLLMEELASKGR